jgi:hypothetical protein
VERKISIEELIRVLTPSDAAVLKALPRVLRAP